MWRPLGQSPHRIRGGFGFQSVSGGSFEAGVIICVHLLRRRVVCGGDIESARPTDRPTSSVPLFHFPPHTVLFPEVTLDEIGHHI